MPPGGRRRVRAGRLVTQIQGTPVGLSAARQPYSVLKISSDFAIIAHCVPQVLRSDAGGRVRRRCTTSRACMRRDLPERQAGRHVQSRRRARASRPTPPRGKLSPWATPATPTQASCPADPARASVPADRDRRGRYRDRRLRGRPPAEDSVPACHAQHPLRSAGGRLQHHTVRAALTSCTY